MYNVEDEKPYVATYKEILIVFITFMFILIVLYPKDLLEKQVLSEESNYDLSMLYLQNMLKNDPENESLMFNLAKQSLRGNRRDLAYRLLKLLKKSENKDMRVETYLLSYEVAKENYYYLLKDNKIQEAYSLYEELQLLNRDIVKHHYYTSDDIETLYEEALFLHDKEITSSFLDELLERNPNNLKYLKNAYYISNNLQHFDESLKFINKLIDLDKKNIQKWKDAKYFLLYKYSTTQKIKEYLLYESKSSTKWVERLAKFYISNKSYKKASKTYMKLFYKSSRYNKKLNYWIKAIKILQAGKYLRNANMLGVKYQNMFIKNKKARIFLLKLYLSTSDLQKANHLSKEILKFKGKI